MMSDDTPRSLGGLISEAFDHASRLIRGEVALAKAELRESLSRAQRGIVMLVVAVVMALVGLTFAAMAAAAGLASAGLHPGWAMLIVAGAFLVIAALLVAAGIKALDPERLAPTRTVKNLRRDAEAMAETMKESL